MIAAQCILEYCATTVHYSVASEHSAACIFDDFVKMLVHVNF